MRLLAVLICLLGSASVVEAHSVHQSTAEVEYNARTHKLEVSLTVFINDLELALIRQSERLMSFEKTPAKEFDAEIQTYLAKMFVVTGADGKAAKLEWLGRELDEDTSKTRDPAVTLFFEVPLPQGVDRAMLQQAVFCDLFQDEVNLVQVRSGGRKVEMQFEKGDGARRLAGGE